MSKSIPTARDSHNTIKIAKSTTARGLQSVYSKTPAAVMSSQKKKGGASDATGASKTAIRTKGGDHVAQNSESTRVWNCNKPKIAKPPKKTYNVYAKQKTSSSKGKVETSNANLKQSVRPPTPDNRAKKEKDDGKIGKKPSNYEFFYVTLPSETAIEKHDDVNELPNSEQFKQLRPAGERHVLNVSEMEALINEVKMRQGKGTMENVMPLPPPPQFAEDTEESKRRQQLQRSRTQTLFSTLDCDELLLKYASHLPHVRSPVNPDANRSKMDMVPSL